MDMKFSWLPFDGTINSKYEQFSIPIPILLTLIPEPLDCSIYLSHGLVHHKMQPYCLDWMFGTIN